MDSLLDVKEDLVGCEKNMNEAIVGTFDQIHTTKSERKEFKKQQKEGCKRLLELHLVEAEISLKEEQVVERLQKQFAKLWVSLVEVQYVKKDIDDMEFSCERTSVAVRKHFLIVRLEPLEEDTLLSIARVIYNARNWFFAVHEKLECRLQELRSKRRIHTL